MTMSLFGPLPIPHRIAGFSLTGTLFILILLGLARHDLHSRGEILGIDTPSSSVSFFAEEQQRHHDKDVDAEASAIAAGSSRPKDSYYVFLQKFPLKSSFKMLFHTEVVVCPRETFKDSEFLNMLNGKLNTLSPSRFDETSVRGASKSPFVAIDKGQWSKQSEPGCVQLGYGGANCAMGCCGSPHKHQNTNYALSSQQAVIENAMGGYKELYLYGVSGSAGGDGGISGEDAYKTVCHGHMNAIEMGGKLPACVSNWAGRDYNPLTNNCNTFTSTILKCVYGLSDAKPHLGVSDMINVKCPAEKKEDGTEIDQCVLPKMDETFELIDKDAITLD